MYVYTCIIYTIYMCTCKVVCFELELDTSVWGFGDSFDHLSSVPWKPPGVIIKCAPVDGWMDCLSL